MKKFNKEEMKKILYFPVLVVQMIWWVLCFAIQCGYVYIRCKITGEGYWAGGKGPGGFPPGFYKTRNGLRYYTSGQIAKEDYHGRCEFVLSPKEVKELIERLKNVDYRITEHGREAARKGILIEDNPWKGFSHEFHIWRNGWVFETNKIEGEKK